MPVLPTTSLPLSFRIMAVMSAVPALSVLALPSPLTVLTEGSLLVQVALLVISTKFPLPYIPKARKGMYLPWGTEGLSKA